MPVALGSLEVWGPIAAGGYAHVSREAHDRFNLVVLDDTGVVCATFRTLTLRSFRRHDPKGLFVPRRAVPRVLPRSTRPPGSAGSR